MRNIKKIIVLLLLTFIVTSCNIKEKIIEDNEITLKGSIKTRELIKDGEHHSISILNLDNPITIDGTSINALLINSLSTIDDNPRVTLTGTLKENTDSFIDLKYTLLVTNITI